jgi:acyl-coenzyme A thioesterase PaaI-like protein
MTFTYENDNIGNNNTGDSLEKEFKSACAQVEKAGSAPFDMNLMSKLLPVKEELHFIAANKEFTVKMFHKKEENKVTYVVRAGERVQGPPGYVHGGAIATLLDDCLGSAVFLSGSFAMTGKVVSNIILLSFLQFAANLNINYRKPIPLNSVRTVEAFLEKQEGRKLYAKGCIYDKDGSVHAEASGLFVVPRHLAQEK